MATGGVEGDGLGTCSICLEPYRGREPKLLPCFHTFCLPCLTKLVSRKDAAQTPGTAGADSGEERGGSADTLTCPNCRRVIPLPPGGVAGFQKNMYLDSSSSSSSGEAAPQPVPCSLCDGDHTAQVLCHQCHNNICSHCRRSHDKCCRGGQVRALQDPPDSSSSSSSIAVLKSSRDQVRALQDPSDSSSSSITALKPSQGQVRQQLQMVEEAVKKLSEEERKLEQERDAMDHSINARYANLLGQAANARDACCRSLREACDGLTQRRHASMAEARQAQDTLQEQLSPSSSSSSSSQPLPAPAVSRAQLRAALFLQGELESILNRDLHSSPLLRHHMEDNPSLMTSLLQAFMGNIVQCSSQASGPAQSQQPSGSLQQHSEDPPGARASSAMGADAKTNLDDLRKKVEDFVGQVSSLHATNTLLSQHVTVLSNANSKLATDQSGLQREVTRLKDGNTTLTTQQVTLQREVTRLKDDNATLTTQQTTLQREVTAMRDKHAIVQQDLAVLTAEKDKACAQLTSLTSDLTSVRTNSSRQQTDILQLKTDHGDVLTKLSGLKTDMTALQGEQSGLKTDVTALHGEQSSLKTDMTALQGEHSSMKKDMTALQGDQSTMKKDMTALQRDQSTMKKDMSALQRDQSTMKKDMTASQRDQSTMKKDVTALQRDQSTMKKDVTALQRDQSTMKDVTALQRDQSTMKKEVDQLKKDCSELMKIQGKLTNLESRFVTANTQIGFHAKMSEDVTTSQAQTLICDIIVSNVGGGYDGQTGVFTAPVTGIYCFLATTSPSEPDVEKKAVLNIVVENEWKEYVYAKGLSWSTGHCVVKVRAGEKVFLRAEGGQEYTFSKGWTRFSGMLLRAEV